jgi:photosystem I subunit 9
MASGPFPLKLQPLITFSQPLSGVDSMKKFLTTAPVFAAIWFSITAGIMIEFNRFFPDLLFHPL